MTSRLLSEAERPRLGDDHYKHTLIPQLPIMDPSDNLPRPATASTISDNLAPPLTVESMVCLGDESVFVVRDRKGEVFLRFPPEQVEFWPKMLHPWRVLRSTMNGEQFRALSECQGQEHTYDPEILISSDWLAVAPLRVQCEHYKRTLIDFDGLVDGGGQATQVERICAAQRGESGEYVSLNNTRVYACEHRTPRDFVSEERLRAFDRKVLDAATRGTEEVDLNAAEADWDQEANRILDETEAAQQQGQDK